MISRHRSLIAGALLVASGACSAAAVQVSNTSGPRAVFQPTAGGYLLKQPGFTPNLSSVPKELNPSAGVKGRGAFGGGSQFRLDGAAAMKRYDMGGTYDMPIPKTNKAVPVTAITKGIPAGVIAKGVFKALPVISTAIAVSDILKDVAQYWDDQDPAGRQSDGPAIVDPATKTIRREKTDVAWIYIGKEYGSPGSACADIRDFWGNSLGVSAVYVHESLYFCNSDSLGGSFGEVYKVEKGTKKVPIPESIIEQFAENPSPSTSEKIEELFNDFKDKPAFKLDVPTDLPTETSGPASAPQSTTTITRPDGSSTTTTTTTTITYQGDKINITSVTNITNKAPDGTVTDGETTETTETPDPVPTDPTDSTDDTEPDTTTPPSDPDMPAVPDFYTQQFPDGFQGAYDTRMGNIKNAPLFGLVNSLLPAATDGGGGCPVWMVNFQIGPWNWGSMNASPPCEVWTFLRVFVMLGALILARALIFGG